MNNVKEIIEQLKIKTKTSERIELRKAFEQLPLAERQAVEQDLIDLLNDDKNEKIDNITRSWAPPFLGEVKTSTAAQAMMKRLPIEKSPHVRLWISKILARNYPEKEGSLEHVIKHFEDEPIRSNRVEIVRLLARSGNPKVIDRLIEFFDRVDHDAEGETQANELGVDDYERIRASAAEGLGQMQAKQASRPLSQHLKQEKSLLVNLAIIDALVKINDRNVVPALVDLLQEQDRLPQLQIATLQALGHLANGEDKEVIKILLETCCSPNRVVAITAADTLITLLKTDAARHLAEFGLRQKDPQKLSRVADALRLTRGTDAINILKTAKDHPEHQARAQALLEQIGGREAVNLLVDQRISALNEAQNRVEEFDKQALDLFHDTINQAKHGFSISLGMSITIFIIGVVLLGVSIYLMIQDDDLSKILGAGSGLTGLGTILAMFYKGPLERVEHAVANLVQTEIAFLGYIRQVTQITAMFEREYLDGDDFGITNLKTLLSYTEHTMKETMPLVNQYTAVPIPQKNEWENNQKESQ